MGILFAGLALPFPPMNGHRLRTWAMVRALSEDGHDVTVVSFAEPQEIGADLTPLRRICRAVDLVPLPSRKSATLEALDRLRTIASPAPYAALRLRSPGLTRALERELAHGRFDALICDGIYNVQNLPEVLPVPVLFNKDDVAHVILRRYLKLETSLVRRLYGALEARKVFHWERAACRRMTAVLACSDLDRALLRELAPAVRIAVVPNVVDTEHYVPAGTPEPHTVVFQGGMDWYPNRDAVEYFARGILPELRRLVPGVTFRVAGRSPSRAFRRRFERAWNVEFTGTVPDMRAEIARATVCVVPLRIGSGTRLKILEAAAMAKPIVSTTLGAEGLDLVDGEEFVLADAPAEFARAVAALLSDEPRRASLGRAARQRIEKAYSFTVLQAALRQAIEECGL